jgi:hypothetical protein
MLEELVDEHLLLQPEPGQYQMHPLVKTYFAQLSHDTAGPQPAPSAASASGGLPAEPLDA